MRRHLLQSLPAGDQPAGEDVLLDPPKGMPGAQVSVVVHEDRLQHHLPLGGEQPIQRLQVLRPKFLADSLDHLDTHDRVERPDNVAVVLDPDLDLVSESSVGDPGACERRLFLRQGHREHPRPPPGSPQRQCAPTGPDLQKPGSRADVGLVEHRIDLALLGALQVLLGERNALLEQRRAVGHRRVEERLEEVVG